MSLSASAAPLRVPQYTLLVSPPQTKYHDTYGAFRDDAGRWRYLGWQDEPRLPAPLVLLLNEIPDPGDCDFIVHFDGEITTDRITVTDRGTKKECWTRVEIESVSIHCEDGRLYETTDAAVRGALELDLVDDLDEFISGLIPFQRMQSESARFFAALKLI